VFLSGPAQLVLFAVVTLAAAVFMAADNRDRAVAESQPLSVSRIVATALAVGVLTGLVGVGGGFLVVPALVALGRIPMKEAIGTSLLVIAMNSAAGVFGYMGEVDVPWRFMSEFIAVAVAGVVAGTYLVRFVPQIALKRTFAVVLMLIAGAVLYQNRGVMLPGHGTAGPSGMAYQK
jgi:uncharacterized membrane protein YfcA